MKPTGNMSVGRVIAFVLVGATLGAIGSIIFAQFFPGVYSLFAPRGEQAIAFVVRLGLIGAIAGMLVGLYLAFDEAQSSTKPAASSCGAADDVDTTLEPAGLSPRARTPQGPRSLVSGWLVGTETSLSSACGEERHAS